MCDEACDEDCDEACDEVCNEVDEPRRRVVGGANCNLEGVFRLNLQLLGEFES